MILLDLHTHNRVDDPSTIAITHVYPNQLPEEQELPAPFSSGIHPWFITPENFSEQLLRIEKLCTERLCVALGESGLDKICDVPMELQQKAFCEMIRLSESMEKPMIVHCVKAFDELLALRKTRQARQPWIIHGFRGNPQQAAQLLDKGIYLSFGHRFNPETVRQIPESHFFIETDDKEQDISLLYQQIAEIRGIPTSRLAAEISGLGRKLFGEILFIGKTEK